MTSVVASYVFSQTYKTVPQFQDRIMRKAMPRDLSRFQTFSQTNVFEKVSLYPQDADESTNLEKNTTLQCSHASIIVAQTREIFLSDALSHLPRVGPVRQGHELEMLIREIFYFSKNGIMVTP